ncbi:hypothetical protein M9H77_11682 [Catharanthus roseus]|uniref:Uncharacterized protein n=1 Tax=Catharanthus roseus TaxID=4058 RepID=A0ACC0BFG0_CATRO|nr:hypothetical protein M9H77_11682 [Catharanthus roseus]
MGVRLFGNRVLVWRLAGIDYEMPKLDSDDLVMGSGLYPWSPTVALHVRLNLDFPAALETLMTIRDTINRSSSRRGVLVRVSPEGHTYSLVPRDMQIPYSATVDLVSELGMLLERTVEVQGDNNCFNHLRDRLIISTPIDVNKMAVVKYPDCDIYVKNVILSGDLTALPFEGYGSHLNLYIGLGPDLLHFFTCMNIGLALADL